MEIQIFLLCEGAQFLCMDKWVESGEIENGVDFVILYRDTTVSILFSIQYDFFRKNNAKKESQEIDKWDRKWWVLIKLLFCWNDINIIDFMFLSHERRECNKI